MEERDDERDLALVAAMARGERAALAELYERHAGGLLGLAIRIVRDRQEAEDLLHDVFLEAWRAADTFDPKRGRVRTWLAVRMRSRALDQQKSSRIRRSNGDAGLETLADERPAEASADHGRIRTALAALSPDQRRVVELAYFDGLSCSEIARSVDIPIGTVKSRLAAGMHRLRADLADGGRPR